MSANHIAESVCGLEVDMHGKANPPLPQCGILDVGTAPSQALATHLDIVSNDSYDRYLEDMATGEGMPEAPSHILTST